MSWLRQAMLGCILITACTQHPSTTQPDSEASSVAPNVATTTRPAATTSSTTTSTEVVAPVKTLVPDVISMTMQDAAALLNTAGLRPVASPGVDRGPNPEVAVQLPPPGTEVEPGSVVITGVERPPNRDLTFLRGQQAQDSITLLGETVTQRGDYINTTLGVSELIVTVEPSVDLEFYEQLLDGLQVQTRLEVCSQTLEELNEVRKAVGAALEDYGGETKFGLTGAPCGVDVHFCFDVLSPEPCAASLQETLTVIQQFPEGVLIRGIG